MQRFNLKTLTVAVFVLAAFAFLHVLRREDDIVQLDYPENSQTTSADADADGDVGVGGVNATENAANATTPAHDDNDDYLYADIYNQTLGFEKIYAIGFSERSDKRDALTMGASYTGIDIEWSEGVYTKSIPAKAYPIGWTEEGHHEKPNDIGAWRAHMNVMRKIVANKISTALVFEDDSDWDVNLKQQMVEFARGSRFIQGSTGETFSPYGHDWDMLWLGHCGMRARDEEHGDPRRYWVTPHDPTVRPPNHQFEFFGPRVSEDPEFAAQRDRLVFAGEGPVCTYGVAVTYNGARKILTELSMMPNNEPLDLGYNAMCGERMGLHFKCIAPWPSLLSSWKSAGPISRDSDIVESDIMDWHDAYSNGIVYSTMLNIMRLANGLTTMYAQWDDVEQHEIDLKSFKIPRGSGWLPDDEMHMPDWPN